MILNRLNKIKYNIYFNVSKKLAKCNKYKLTLYILLGIYI